MAPSATKPIAITKVIRELRGRSQSRLVQGDDGYFYAAKFAGNPQGTRTLINEWIISQLMNDLGVSAPVGRILYLPTTIREESTISFKIGNRNIPVAGDFHFGSPYVANPNTTALFDFLPETLWEKINNRADFAAAFVVDKWTYHTDSRQAVFARQENGFRAAIIDHGMCFDGVHWELREATLNGLYWNKRIYSGLSMKVECARILAKIEQISEDRLMAMVNSLPHSWFAPGDQDELYILMKALIAKRERLARTIERTTHILQI